MIDHKYSFTSPFQAKLLPMASRWRPVVHCESKVQIHDILIVQTLFSELHCSWSGFPTSTKGCQGVVRDKTRKHASTSPFEAKSLI